MGAKTPAKGGTGKGATAEGRGSGANRVRGSATKVERQADGLQKLGATLLLSAVVCALALLVRFAAQAHVAFLMAGFSAGEPLAVSEATRAVHSSLFLVDMHCDATFTQRCGPASRRRASR
jgi:hypothetical protein